MRPDGGEARTRHEVRVHLRCDRGIESTVFRGRLWGLEANSAGFEGHSRGHWLFVGRT